MEIKKIVLTGGPCAGKTTALSIIPHHFEKLGWKVIVQEEAATQIFGAGFKIPDFASNLDFQCFLADRQLTVEGLTDDYCRQMQCDKILIVHDRGLCDNKAYMTEADFKTVLDKMRISPEHAMTRYDGVFHLVTAADGAEEFYTTANNTVRTETPEQARALDNATMNAWVGHPHLRVIGNQCNFEQKMYNLLAEIASLLGEPQPYEVERKYLIYYPDIDQLRAMPNCHETQILQTYLVAGNGREIRVRQRGMNGDYTFTKTTKIDTGDPMKRIEVEERISKDQYLHELMDADQRMHPIKKTRFCIMQKDSGEYFEIDVYPDTACTAILEVESTESGAVHAIQNLPDGVRIIREVTNDPSYRNLNFARNGVILR